MAFANLHGHTTMSNLRLKDCINRPEDVLDTAKELGLKGVAITDHESLSAFIRAERHLSKRREEDESWNDFKFVRGNEIYLVRDGLTKENFVAGDDRFYHFILLARDYKGYQQLAELASRAARRSFKRNLVRVPTYYEDLEEVIGAEKGHVVGSTACLGSQIGSWFTGVLNSKWELDYATEKATEWLTRLNDLFGQGNFFIELQPDEGNEQVFVNNHLIRLSRKLDIPFIITTDFHYLRPSDRDTHRAWLKSQAGDREVDAFYNSCYLMTEKEMHDKMDDEIGADQVEEAFANTMKILNSVQEYSLLKKVELPYLPKERFDVRVANPLEPKTAEVIKEIPLLQDFLDSDDPSDKQMASRLILFLQGSDGKGEPPRYTVERKSEQMNRELKIIRAADEKQGLHWSRYFNQVADYVEIFWTDGGSFVAPGRGSAAASYVCFGMGITQVDPTREKAKLIFERFMNPDRASILDIDSDVAANKRDQCIRALEKVYGEDHVIRVSTFRTETAKNAIKTAARAFDMDPDEATYIAGLIKGERGINYTLDEAYYGDSEKGIHANKKFIEEMNRHPALWQMARSIEGMTSGIGSHAGGVVITEEPITQTLALSVTNSGDLVTAYDLHQIEDMGLIKIDLLATAGVQKIQTCVDLLCDHGYLERGNSLRETYDRAIDIYKIDRLNPEMWDMANEGKIISLFQMEQQSGVQGMRLTKPRTVEALATLNSVIRLMGSEKGQELPLEKFGRFSKDPSLWETEMINAGLTEDQRKMLHSMFDHSFGISAQQEDLYQLMLEPSIVGYSFGMADKLRKAVAKKNGNDFEIFEKQFFKDAEANGSDMNLVAYIWKNMVRVQKGYSFNLSHTLSYSLVALQEMNLAYFYPTIFWNTANLIVDSGSEYGQGEMADGTGVDYGKIAAAIGRMQDYGIKVLPPDINESQLTFTPNAKKNTISYGLTGIVGVGDQIVNSILENRPFKSWKECIEKIHANKTQAISLIKSGAFDEFGNKEKVMKQYLLDVSGVKAQLNLRNLNALLTNKLLPDKFSEQSKVFFFNKYIRKGIDKENKRLPLDEVSEPFFNAHYNVDKLFIDDEGKKWIPESYWNPMYDRVKDVFRKYIKENQEELLLAMNKDIIDSAWQKYASGSLAKWSMDSVVYYQDEHELEGVDFGDFDVKDFFSLPIEPEVASSFTTKRGNEVNLYRLCYLAGTVIDKDKNKASVTLLTTTGVVTVKAYGIFDAYDKQTREKRPDGTQRIVEKSHFARGTKLLVRGFRRGDQFIAKSYKGLGGEHISHIERIVGVEDGKVVVNR